MASEARRHTDRQLLPGLETYRRGDVLVLMVAPHAVYWAGSTNLLGGLALLFVLVVTLGSGHWGIDPLP